METVQRRGGSNLLFPLLLIGVGAFWLLGNFNILSWNIWEIVARLWPVLLISAGLQMLFGRNSTAGSLAVAGITVLMLGAGLVYYAPEFRGGTMLADETISQPLNGAERAEISIGGGVGRFLVSGSDTDELIEGQIDLGRNERVEQDFSVSGDTARYTLHSRGQRSLGFMSFANREDRVWDLRLSQDVPINLSIDAGVGESVLDLESLTLTALDIDLGAGEGTVTLPREGDFEATIDGGVGELTIEIPEGMAARVEVDNGIGSVDMDDAFDRQGETYVLGDYENAGNRVNLKINMGVGDIQIDAPGR